MEMIIIILRKNEFYDKIRPKSYKNLTFKFQNTIVDLNNIYNTDKKIINIIKENLS